MTSSTNATDLSGKVAVVTGAAAGLGRAEAIGLARLGATVVVNDIAAALDASDVIDEISTAGSKVDRRRRRHQPTRDGRRTGRLRRRAGRTGHRGEQRRDHPRPDAVQHDRRGMGPRHRGAPARAFPADPQRRHVLAQQSQRGQRRQDLRPARQHLVGGGPGGSGGAGQLRRREGGHHRADPDGRAGAGPLRGVRQRDLSAGPHRDDGRCVRTCPGIQI